MENRKKDVMGYKKAKIKKGTLTSDVYSINDSEGSPLITSKGAVIKVNDFKNEEHTYQFITDSSKFDESNMDEKKQILAEGKTVPIGIGSNSRVKKVIEIKDGKPVQSVNNMVVRITSFYGNDLDELEQTAEDFIKKQKLVENKPSELSFSYHVSESKKRPQHSENEKFLLKVYTIMPDKGEPINTFLSKFKSKNLLENFLQLSLSIIKSVEELHNRGLAHQDLNCENFLYVHHPTIFSKNPYTVNIIDLDGAVKKNDQLIQNDIFSVFEVIYSLFNNIKGLEDKNISSRDRSLIERIDKFNKDFYSSNKKDLNTVVKEYQIFLAEVFVERIFKENDVTILDPFLITPEVTQGSSIGSDEQKIKSQVSMMVANRNQILVQVKELEERCKKPFRFDFFGSGKEKIIKELVVEKEKLNNLTITIKNLVSQIVSQEPTLNVSVRHQPGKYF